MSNPTSHEFPAHAHQPDGARRGPGASGILPHTAAGTPVTIEGNYFGTLPQVFFGGVPASNVHVDWDGQLTADAPADPAGVRNRPGRRHGHHGRTARRAPLRYAGRQRVHLSPRRPPQGHVGLADLGFGGPAGQRGDPWHQLHDAGVAPIVDFGNVASIGSMSYNSNQITTTIPPSINPGAVNITVTTPAGTSQVSANDLFTYSGSGASTAPTITSGNATTFSAGNAGSFNVTSAGTPAASSISDSAFSGCTPSPLPSGFLLVYAGGTTATLEGTPVAGDGGTYAVCLVASNGIGTAATQSFTLTVNAPPAPPPPPPPPATPPPRHARLLVGRFGRRHLQFRSRAVPRLDGSLHLQRPIVGITPTADRGGYWLVASDGGIFAFGDAGFHGSIPGAGLNPAGSGLPHSLNAPIVGMVPVLDGGGYFMVSSDGGSSPSVTPGSPGRARGSAAAKAPPWP